MCAERKDESRSTEEKRLIQLQKDVLANVGKILSDLEKERDDQMKLTVITDYLQKLLYSTTTSDESKCLYDQELKLFFDNCRAIASDKMDHVNKISEEFRKGAFTFIEILRKPENEKKIKSIEKKLIKLDNEKKSFRTIKTLLYDHVVKAKRVVQRSVDILFKLFKLVKSAYKVPDVTDKYKDQQIKAEKVIEEYLKPTKEILLTVCHNRKEIQNKVMTIDEKVSNGKSENLDDQRKSPLGIDIISDALDNGFRIDLELKKGSCYCSDCMYEFSYSDKKHEHSSHHYYEIPDTKTCVIEDIQEGKKHCKRSFSPTDLRIASWNIKRLSDNSGPMLEKRLRCICRTILYHQVDVIALQEVCDCEELELMLIHTLRHYSRLEWTAVKEKVDREHLLIVFNKECFINVERLIVEQKICIPKIMSCKLQLKSTTSLTIINTHITYTDKSKREVELGFLKEVEPLLNSHPILLGDFNAEPKVLADKMGKDYYHCIVKENEKTTVGKKSYDNMVIKQEEQGIVHRHFVGLIVNRGEFGDVKDVSDHFPIIADFDLT